MKTTSVLILASAALASAQVKFEDGKYICEKADAAFCAGDSMGTDIIIRCNGDKIGVAGRCSNNLAGQPPIGNHPALCHQSSPTAGDAACEKNCVVYPGSGEPFTLPASECTVDGGAEPTTTITYINPGPTTETAEPTTTITFIDPAPTTETAEPTTTITFINPGPSTEAGESGASTFTTAMVNPGSNGTATGTRTGGPGLPVSTAGAVANQVAGTLAVLGGIAAMLL
ncbi:uncharacterized protein B0H64DRAFT_438402 [Chaetomium fimeti]|uniref:Uncharacterized protein n=1 Tax=Chaetomium fimeti TaxID=1854472 RepID=A0AAE0HRD5_9PEZI|nr:hypothetical protein B0H64DRAFT_438402 [Chaetomium fimeti]